MWFFACFIYLFKNIGAHTRYKPKAKIKLFRTPQQSQDIETPLTWHCNINTQRNVQWKSILQITR